MEQIVDLQNDPTFQALDVAILSVALDSAEQQQQGIQEYNIRDVPMLVDADAEVSETYDVMQWAVGTGEPGHTFILVDEQGEIAWIRDYGAPQNGGLMYVPSPEMNAQIAESLQG
jgi:peroxiredoxin